MNLLYKDTVCKLGVHPVAIHLGNTSFQGVTPGSDTPSMGFLTLEATFGSPDNFRSEKLTFHIAPFVSRYQALLGREAFTRFNAIPHYASLTLKIRPKGHHFITREHKLTPKVRAGVRLPRQPPTNPALLSRTRLDESGVNMLNSRIPSYKGIHVLTPGDNTAQLSLQLYFIYFDIDFSHAYFLLSSSRIVAMSFCEPRSWCPLLSS